MEFVRGYHLDSDLDDDPAPRALETRPHEGGTGEPGCAARGVTGTPEGLKDHSADPDTVPPDDIDDAGSAKTQVPLNAFELLRAAPSALRPATKRSAVAMKKEGSATHKAVAVDIPARAARAVEDVPEAGTGRCQNGEKQGREPPPAPLWARRGQSSHPDIANSRVCGSADGANGVGGDDVEVVPSHAEAKATFFMTAAEKRAAKLEEEERERARRAEQAREEFQKEKAQQRVVTAMMNQGKTGESAFFAINRQRQLAAAERRAVQEKSAADGSAAGASSPRALGPALAPLHVGRPRGPCLPDTCDNRIAMEAAPRGDVVDVDVSAFELVSQRAAQGGSKPRGGCRVEGAEVLLAEAARYLAGVEVPVGNTGQGRGADGVEQIENEARAALVSSAESLARLVARREGEVARERAAPGRAGEMPVPKRPRLQPGEPIEIDSSDADDVAPAPGPTDDGRETQAAGGLMSTLQWVDALAPEHHSQVCGNPESARRLRDWLAGWAQRIDREAGEGGDGGATSKGSRNTEGRSGKRARRSGRVAEDFDELIGNYTEETLCQGAILVYGPPGVGKSATVTSCAQELGFQTLEVNAGSERTGAHLNKFIGEATKSRRLPGKGSDRGPSATTALADMFSDAAVGKGKRKGAGMESRGDKGRGSRTVLVLEEVDVLADEDRGFSAALGQLIMETKRPIILTSSVPRPACVPAGVRVEAVRFGRVAEEDIVRLLVAATIALRATASFQALREIAAASNGDLRRAVATAQVWLQKPAAVAQAVGSPRSPSGFLTAPAVSGDVVDEALGSIARICLSPGRVPVLSTSGRAVDAPSGGGVLSRVHDECTGRLLGLMCSTSAGRSSDRTGKGGLLLAPARGGLVAGDLERTCGVRLGDLCDSRAPARGRLCSTVDRDVPVVATETPLRGEAGVAATVMTGSPWSDTIEDPDTPLTAGKQPEDSTEELAQPVLDTSHATPSTPGNRQQVATCSSDESSDSGSEERGAVDVVASLLPSSRATATARCRITYREVMLAVLGEPVPGPRASPACWRSGGDREVPSGAADLGTLADCLDSLSCCDLLKCGRPDIVDMAFPLPAARHRPAFAGMGAAPASSTSISAGAGGNFLATALGHSVAAPGGLEALLLAGGGVLDVDDEVSPWGRASDGAEPRCQVGAAQTLHDEAAECAASLALAVATAGMDGVKGAEPQHPGSDASGAAVGIEAVASGPHSSAHVLARQIESVSLLHRAAALVAPRAALEGPMPVLDRAMGLVKIAGVLSAQDDEAGQGSVGRRTLRRSTRKQALGAMFVNYNLDIEDARALASMALG